MPVHYLRDLTWSETRDLAQGAVAVLPVGAIEAHGPHLPLDTDLIIADAMADEGARRLAQRGRTVVVFPAVAYTPAPFAAAFAGTLSCPPAALTDQVSAVGDGARRAGFALLAVANAHLDPAHLGALRAAVAALRADGMAVAFPDLTQRALAARLTPEFQSGACHAGQYETSVVLAVGPDRVRDAIRRGLPPVPASLVTAIREGKQSFAEAGGPDAYFGFPADASADEGHATIRTLGELLAEAVIAETAS